MSLFRRKSVASLQAEAAADQRLARVLGGANLTMIGIGAIIGTGTFILTGQVAADHAGPAVTLSFAAAALASIFVALCYAELASVLPSSGSAYTYGYATLGELIAWIIGWDLILEYGLGAATVAIAWSGYVVSFLRDLGFAVPCAYTAARGMVVGCAGGTSTTAIVNLPAVLIIVIATTLLVIGIRATSIANQAMVVIKVAVVLLFIVGAAHAVSPANWHPFVPPAVPGPSGQFGWGGVITGASVVFSAYVGFDAVSTAAQEAKHPQRDLPIGILASLLICTVLYIGVSAVVTGVVSYTKLPAHNSIDFVAEVAGLGWMVPVIKVGGIMGLSSVILVMLYGQSRVFYSMSRDGLLPAFAGTVHPALRTPYLASIVTGAAVACIAGIVPIDDVAKLVSIGALLAFVIVSIGAMVLRYREPNVQRAFRAPALYLVAPLGALSSLYLMYSLPWPTWLRLIIWFIAGMVVFALYGVHHSNLNRPREGDERVSMRGESGALLCVVGVVGLVVVYAMRPPGGAMHSFRPGSTDALSPPLYEILMSLSAIVAAAGGATAWRGSRPAGTFRRW